ncbi:unnamed protein product [Closterium sp. NIES-65]|nr:unnamed protein product [Closterium sp. NIES-65]
MARLLFVVSFAVLLAVASAGQSVVTGPNNPPVNLDNAKGANGVATEVPPGIEKAAAAGGLDKYEGTTIASLYSARFTCLPARPPLTSPRILLSPPHACFSRLPALTPLASPRVHLSPPLYRPSCLPVQPPLTSLRVLHSPPLAWSSHLTLCAPLAPPRVLLSPHLACPSRLPMRAPLRCVRGFTSRLLTASLRLATASVRVADRKYCPWPLLTLLQRLCFRIPSARPLSPSSTPSFPTLLAHVSPPCSPSQALGGVLLSPHLPWSTLTGHGAPLLSPPVLHSGMWDAPLSSPPVLPSDRGVLLSPHLPCSPLTGGVLLSPHLPWSTLTGHGCQNEE